MRRLLVLAACAFIASGCDSKAPTTEPTAQPQPRRLMKADGGAVTGAPIPGAKQ